MNLILQKIKFFFSKRNVSTICVFGVGVLVSHFLSDFYNDIEDRNREQLSIQESVTLRGRVEDALGLNTDRGHSYASALRTFPNMSTSLTSFRDYGVLPGHPATVVGPPLGALDSPLGTDSPFSPLGTLDSSLGTDSPRTDSPPLSTLDSPPLGMLDSPPLGTSDSPVGTSSSLASLTSISSISISGPTNAGTEPQGEGIDSSFVDSVLSLLSTEIVPILLLLPAFFLGSFCLQL